MMTTMILIMIIMMMILRMMTYVYVCMYVCTQVGDQLMSVTGQQFKESSVKLEEDDACDLQPHENTVKVDNVCHTHDSISNHFTRGKSFGELISGLDCGRFEPLREAFLKLEVVE